MIGRIVLFLLLPALALAQPAEVRHEPMELAAAPILGREVLDPTGAPAGRIVDVLVDDTGQPRAAIVDAGGFMGMGTRRVAVAWRTLRFQTSAGRAGRIVLDMTLDQIKDIPEFKRSVSPADPPITVAVPPPPRPQPEPQSTPEPPPRP